jgi:septum formation inhibitor-activating ATPase MinD
MTSHSPDDERCRALVITGGLGSGKTSVAIDLAAHLDQTETTYALIDLDFLCWAKPAPDCALSIHQLLLMNLVPVVRGFQSAGIRHFILARFFITTSEVVQLREALALADIHDVTIVELAVSPETALTRLAHRDHGATLEAHRHMVASISADENIAEFRISTDDLPISDVTSQILTFWGLGA